MARRRRSPALFEVIHRGTLPSSGQSNPHPPRLFNLRLPHLERLAFWRRSMRARPTARTDLAGDVQTVVAVPAAPRLADYLAEPERRELAAGPARPLDLRVDRDRQRVHLRFSYHSAAITAFAVVVALSLAFIVGRMNRGPVPAGALSTEQVKAGAINGEVGNIPRPAGENGAQPPPQLPSPEARLAGATAGAGALVVEDAQRTNNLNYYVLFSSRDEKKARDAVEVYARGDVKTTVEKDCPGFSGMYCVVGLTGFSRTGSREAMIYVQEVEKITQKFAGAVVHPAPFKWREVK